MAVGTIIAFVGTGEKGFKTLELRLIGPSLIGAGVLVVFLRIALCVCPFHCLKHRRKHKHKHKNSTNKQNSENATLLKSETPKVEIKAPHLNSTDKSRDITATVSFLECERAIEMKPLNPPIIKEPKTDLDDVSVTSLINGILVSPEKEPPKGPKVLSKFEKARVPKNARSGELLLSPLNLEDLPENV